MYDRPRRRSGNRIVGVRARRIPTEAHEGSHRDFLRRHEREASEVARGTAQEKREFSRCLLRRIADPRNLFCAIEHVARDPDKAPGPNGVRADRLENFERWNLARTLSEVVRDRGQERSHYRPGPVRTVPIAKAGGGTRPIEIQNIEDRVVHRATAQILGPLLDPQFSPYAVGFRPGLGREYALAFATNLIQPGNLTVISEDIRNAFGSVPRNRLIDCLGATGITDDVCDLVARAMSRATRRGIPQGSALSPLMLNVYLNHFLDGPWLDQHPGRPVIRFADNLLLAASDEQEATRLYNELRELLLPTGMLLKYGRDSSIRNLETGQAVDWLGYRMTRLIRLEIGIGPDSWTRLEDHLAECQAHPDATLRATEVVIGTLDQWGPAYGSENIENVVARVQGIAAAQGFGELPTGEELEQTWRGAYVRFRAVKRVVSSSITVLAGGSAHQHRDSADNSRGLGGPAPAGFLRPTFTFPEVRLCTDGSCLGSNGPGGFAYVAVWPDGRREFRSGSVLRSTNNRMELTAVIRGLEAIEQPSRVTLEADSRYVVDGLTQHLVDWRLHRWRLRGGGRLANADLWRRLDELVERHQVNCRWVRGHSGHAENELCDRAAREAALRVISTRSSSNRSN